MARNGEKGAKKVKNQICKPKSLNFLKFYNVVQLWYTALAMEGQNIGSLNKKKYKQIFDSDILDSNK